jgi:hypothetical protein
MYTGYLTAHLHLLRDSHARGAGTREIAELLYAAGARSDTSEPGEHVLTYEHHIANLRTMALYALTRLGLPVRKTNGQPQREQALAMRQTGLTFRQIGEELGVGVERARQLVQKAERLARQPSWHNALPARVQNFLRNNDLATLPELEAARAVAQITRRELSSIPNLGAGARSALITWLSKHGLRLQTETNLKTACGPAAKKAAATDRTVTAEKDVDQRCSHITILPPGTTPLR